MCKRAIFYGFTIIKLIRGQNLTHQKIRLIFLQCFVGSPYRIRNDRIENYGAYIVFISK